MVNSKSIIGSIKFNNYINIQARSLLSSIEFENTKI